MKVTFDSFDEFADWVYRKNLAYEELRDENIQLEMDRMKDSDKIAQLEHIIFKLREEKADQQKLIDEMRAEFGVKKHEDKITLTAEMPKALTKKATAENSD